MKNTHGGGKKTTENGLKFERETDINTLLKEKGHTLNPIIKGNKSNEQLQYTKILDKENNCFISAPKYCLYHYLTEKGIKYNDYNSKKFLPDECLIFDDKKEVFIIEKKFQDSDGSVDEKLVTCEFKRFEYLKLFKQLGYEVHFIFILCDWFRQFKYRDMLEYVNSKENCSYYFNELPLSVLFD